MADKKLRTRLNEMRQADDAALNQARTDAQKSIYQFRKDRLSKPQENVKVVKNARKEIARILTVKRERELAAERGE